MELLEQFGNVVRRFEVGHTSCKTGGGAGWDQLARGASNREISETLYIAGGTIKNHLSNILGKLEVCDRTQAALKARELSPL